MSLSQTTSITVLEYAGGHKDAADVVPLYYGLRLTAWVKIGVVTVLMVALFRTNLLRLWLKTNPIDPSRRFPPAFARHSPCLPHRTPVSSIPRGSGRSRSLPWSLWSPNRRKRFPLSSRTRTPAAASALRQYTPSFYSFFPPLYRIPRTYSTCALRICTAIPAAAASEIDHHHGISLVHKARQHAKEHLYIGEMETGGRFVENIERLPRTHPR